MSIFVVSNYASFDVIVRGGQILGNLPELNENIDRLHDWRADIAFEMQKLPNYPGAREARP